MTKYDKIWEGLDPTFREYLKKQPHYFYKDIVKAGIVAAIFGFLIGLAVGFEWAYNFKLYIH